MRARRQTFFRTVGLGLLAGAALSMGPTATAQPGPAGPPQIDETLAPYASTADSVKLPDGRVVDDAYFTIVLNTSPYTYLGNRPLDLAPEATLDTGLSVVVIRTMQFARVLGLIGSALGRGTHLRTSKHALLAHDLDELVISGHGPVPYQVDGDFLGEGEEFRFEHRPEALNLVVP